jgi:hypothetical protein
MGTLREPPSLRPPISGCALRVRSSRSRASTSSTSYAFAEDIRRASWDRYRPPQLPKLPLSPELNSGSVGFDTNTAFTVRFRRRSVRSFGNDCSPPNSPPKHLLLRTRDRIARGPWVTLSAFPGISARKLSIRLGYLMQPRDSVTSRNGAVRHWDYYSQTCELRQSGSSPFLPQLLHTISTGVVHNSTQTDRESQ